MRDNNHLNKWLHNIVKNHNLGNDAREQIQQC